MASEEAPQRGPLVENAIKFLQDPQVQQSPLSKRVAFLESKGLTTSEIDHALLQAGTPLADRDTTREESPALPPLPTLGQAHRPFDWQRMLLLAAFITSTGFAISQSHFAKQMATWLKRVTSRFRDYFGHTNNSPVHSKDDPVFQLKREIEDVKNNVRFAYSQIDQEIEELRDEFVELKKSLSAGNSDKCTAHHPDPQQ